MRGEIERPAASALVGDPQRAAPGGFHGMSWGDVIDVTRREATPF
jgi:hypothetical protein